MSIQGVELAAPHGFERAELFPGFQQEQTGGSVMISVIPGPYVEVVKGFEDERRAAERGLAIISRIEAPAERDTGLLLQVRQEQGGVTFMKWLRLFGGSERTAMVMATFPEAHAAALSESMKRCVLSARWSSQERQATDPFSELLFTLDRSPLLQTMTPMLNGLSLTQRPPPVRDLEEPLLVVASSHSRVRIDDVRAFAVQRLHQTPNISDLTVTTERALTVDGLPGYELVAEALDTRTSSPLTLYQLVVVDQAQAIYFVVHGSVGTMGAGTFLPEFRRVAASFQRKAAQRLP